MPKIPMPRIEYRIIEALNFLGASGWHSRLAIARALSHERLNKSEIAALDRLAVAGRIEQRTVATPNTPLLSRHEYRLKGENAEGQA